MGSVRGAVGPGAGLGGRGSQGRWAGSGPVVWSSRGRRTLRPRQVRGSRGWGGCRGQRRARRAVSVGSAELGWAVAGVIGAAAGQDGWL